MYPIAGIAPPRYAKYDAKSPVASRGIMFSPVNLTICRGSPVSSILSLSSGIDINIKSIVTNVSMSVTFAFRVVDFFIRYARVSSIPMSADVKYRVLSSRVSGWCPYGLFPKPDKSPNIISSDI